MSSSSNELRDFLLNRLPPEQAEAIEERMFQDEAYFSDLQDAEDELIEEYAMDAMDPSEAELFKARVAGDPELQERVAMRRVLIGTLQRVPSDSTAVAAATPSRIRRAPWSRFLVPGFALAIAILFFVSYEAEHRNERPVQTAGTEAPPSPASGANRQETMAEAAAVLFLPAHVARGAEQQPSMLHLGNAAVVRLELETPASGASIRWNVRIADGETVFSAEGLKPRQAGVVSYVVAEVRTSQLPPKTYRVTLSPESSAGAVATTWDLQVVQ